MNKILRKLINKMIRYDNQDKKLTKFIITEMEYNNLDKTGLMVNNKCYGVEICKN